MKPNNLSIYLSYLNNSSSKGGHISSDAAQHGAPPPLPSASASAAVAGGGTAGCSTESAREWKLALRSRSSSQIVWSMKGPPLEDRCPRVLVGRVCESRCASFKIQDEVSNLVSLSSDWEEAFRPLPPLIESAGENLQ